jgi:diguanylate cyclase (GGDEF)-like protein/PAS domain S-box-containing protein
MKKDVPLLFLTHRFKREIAAELILKGAADCIESENTGQFSVAIYRVLNINQLRDQRDRAQKDLRLSEARYRALAGNLSYGICRCSLDGQFLEVNQTMMKILGYDTKAELLAQFHAREIILDPTRRAQLLGHSGGDALVQPIETEWKQKDGTVLTVRLSGREVLGERGELEAYEVIAEDVTKQREIDVHLRQQATSDPLTGLANYRRLVDVLDSEIKRSKRSRKGFALLFFDVDGLKLINDRYGHITGNQALCRLADVLSSSCRDIDTPARFAGDEFAVVLPEIQARDAKQVAQRVCESLANDANGPTLSVSVGIAVYPQDGNSIETLLCEADSRLYSMKHQKALPALAKHSGTV